MSTPFMWICLVDDNGHPFIRAWTADPVRAEQLRANGLDVKPLFEAPAQSVASSGPVDRFLPCPFCGSAPQVNDDKDGVCYVSCEAADCGIAEVQCPTADDAAEFWNRRASPRSSGQTRDDAQGWGQSDERSVLRGALKVARAAIWSGGDTVLTIAVIDAALSSDGSCSVPTATIAATQTVCDEGESAGDIQSRDATARRMSETVGSLALGQSTQREDGASPGPSESLSGTISYEETRRRCGQKMETIWRPIETAPKGPTISVARKGGQRDDGSTYWYQAIGHYDPNLGHFHTHHGTLYGAAEVWAHFPENPEHCAPYGSSPGATKPKTDG